MINIETPVFSHGSDVERLAQIQSYLIRMAQQLQYAFDTVDTSIETGATGQAAQTAAEAQEKTPQQVFSSIKNLIIKSADIVNAYSTEISKNLEGVYVAQSDFGTYQQQTAQTILATDQRVDQLFKNNQTITETLDGLYNRASSTDAYIRTGQLGDDEAGLPIYGIEVGQTNTVDGAKTFDKFARFTSDRLSFFDRNDVEVAYVSDYRMYITNAEVTGSLIVGSYRINTAGGHLAFKWIGGE